MKVSISIPTILRPLTENKKKLEFESDSALETVQSLLDSLEIKFPGIHERVCEGNSVRSFMNIYVNDNDIRFTDNLATQVGDGDNIIILPAVAGG